MFSPLVKLPLMQEVEFLQKTYHQISEGVPPERTTKLVPTPQRGV